MKYLRDPEGAELEHLVGAGKFLGAAVLEIGCGNGTLTWQYAGLPAMVVGIDPGAGSLQEAEMKQPASPPHVHFTQAKGEALPFPSERFNTVIFASSL